MINAHHDEPGFWENWDNPTMNDVFRPSGSNNRGNSENGNSNQDGGNRLGNRAPTVPSVPVPAAVWLFGTAMLGFLFSVRRKG